MVCSFASIIKIHYLLLSTNEFYIKKKKYKLSPLWPKLNQTLLKIKSTSFGTGIQLSIYLLLIIFFKWDI